MAIKLSKLKNGEGEDAFNGQQLACATELRPVPEDEQDLALALSACRGCREGRVSLCERLGIMPGMESCTK
jgi:hypothetical protein